MSVTQDYKTVTVSPLVAQLLTEACIAKIAAITDAIESDVAKEFPLSTRMLEESRAALLDVVDAFSTGVTQ